MRHAQELAGQANQLASADRWRDTLPLYFEITNGITRAFGHGSKQADDARRALADAFSMVGRYPESRNLLHQCLATRIDVFGETNALVADAHNRIGETFRREGNFVEAETLYDKAEKCLGDTNDGFELRGVIANNRGLVASTRGDLAGAEHQFLNCLNHLKKSPRPDVIFVATAMSALGETRLALGRPIEAEADQRQALALLAGFPDHVPARIAAENNLANVLRARGRTAEALAIHERTIATMAAQRTSDDLGVLGMRRNQALTLARAEMHVEAANVIEDTLARLVRMKQTGHPLFLALQVDRADRMTSLGDLNAARELCERIVNAQIEVSGNNHPSVWAARDRLASVAQEQGDLATARKLFSEVLDHRRPKASQSPRFTEDAAQTIVELAQLRRVIGSYEVASELLVEAEAMVGSNLPPSHPVRFDIVTERGFLDAATGNIERAMRHQRTALDGRLKALGEESLPAARSRANVADLLSQSGNFAEALEQMIRAYATITNLAPVGSPLRAGADYNLALSFHRSGDLARAAGHYESARRELQEQSSRYLPLVERDLALLQIDLGEKRKALEFARSAVARERQLWHNVLRFAPESARLSWRDSHDVFSALGTLGATDPVSLFEAVLQFKGTVLDSLIEDTQIASARKTPENVTLLADLDSARAARYRLELMALSRQPPSVDQIRSARDAVERLEVRLSERVFALAENRRSSTATLGKVQDQIPGDAVLVEFVRYLHWLGKGKTEPRYGAIVVATNGSPVWVPLGSAVTNGPIAGAISLWQQSIYTNTPPVGAGAIAPLATLHNLVWSPISAVLPRSIRTVIIAPDGDLNFVSFAALWRGDGFLGEHLLFRYVTTARDLISVSSNTVSEKRISIFAAPEFSPAGWRPPNHKSAPSARSAWEQLGDILSLRSGSLDEALHFNSELASTRSEAEQLVRLATSKKWAVDGPFLGSKATEAAVRKLSRPYILHIATHGTFLSDFSVSELVRDSRLSGNQPVAVLPRRPMHRNWLAFAGANKTIAAWREGVVPDPMNDGLLTADEASRLRLEGTWLVTLSACDTGQGVGRTGEGVFGLRRGFALAGARNLVMTLWPVQSGRTAELMAAFYADAFATGDAPAALGRVQKRLLAEWRKQDPAQAARWAGAFVISSFGR